MADSRREFLVRSAKLAAAAAAGSVAGCGNRAVSDSGQVLRVTAGPRPRQFDAEQPLRFGIVGAGARMQYCLNELAKNPGISITAIAEPQQANIDATLNIVQKLFKNSPEVYRDPDDYKNKLLAREDVDAVLLATPCDQHTPMYLECFAAGKHFYGEKPMSISASEANAMVAAAEKNPEVIAQIGFQRRATPLYQMGIKLIHSGLIGEPADVRAAWNNGMGPLGRPDEGERVWLGRRQRSGDWMLEQACHAWDVLNWVAQDLPVAASGMGRRDLFKDMDPQRDVTDLYYAHLEYPSFFVDFEHSWIAPPNDEMRFFGIFERVAGLKGGIALNEGKFYPRDSSKQMQQYGSPIGDPLWTEQSLRSFVASLRERKPVVAGVREGRNATLTGLLVRKAVDERRRVEMREL